MVEGARLESVYTVKGIKGSNPFLSANATLIWLKNFKIMINFLKNITFIIVSYKSKNIIENCIKSINSISKILIVENSSNKSFKNNLEKNILI